MVVNIVQFGSVSIREHETILVGFNETSADTACQYLVCLKRDFLKEYKMSIEEYEFVRHEQGGRVERNHESDCKDRKTRSLHVDQTLLHRGREKVARLLGQHRIVHHWHIRDDGCVYREDGHHSSKVVHWAGKKFWTSSGRSYTLGEVDPRLRIVFEVLHQKSFPTEDPLSQNVDILSAIRILNKEINRTKDISKAVDIIVAACRMTNTILPYQ